MMQGGKKKEAHLLENLYTETENILFSHRQLVGVCADDSIL